MITYKNNIVIAFLLGLTMSLLVAGFTAAGPLNQAYDPLFSQESSTESDDSIQLHFRYFPENDKDQQINAMLENTHLLQRMQDIFQQNFKPPAPIYFHIQHSREAQLIETEIEAASQVVTLPYSFLYTLYQGLSSKYDQQQEIVDLLFSATVEFYLWSEIANIFIQQHKFEVEGKRSTAMDNFAAVMMLNQNTASADYLIDGGEAYLLIHSLLSSQEDEDVQNELESDQQRYKHILCLSLGFDQLTRTMENAGEHLASFSLTEEQVDQCQLRYLEIMRNWYQALTPSLRETNVLNYWLNQESLMNTTKEQ
jgi:hypothetical protein